MSETTTELVATKYSYSTDEENYHGSYDTVEAASDEAAADVGIGRHFWVGENQTPIQPEWFWHASDWLEQVSIQDEYSMECCEGWDHSTRELREELEQQVRNVMGAWLDRHGLRPKFWSIEKPRRFFVAGKIENVYEIESLS